MQLKIVFQFEVVFRFEIDLLGAGQGQLGADPSALRMAGR